MELTVLAEHCSQVQSFSACPLWLSEVFVQHGTMLTGGTGELNLGGNNLKNSLDSFFSGVWETDEEQKALS